MYTNEQIKKILGNGKRPFVRLSPIQGIPARVNKHGNVSLSLPYQEGLLITQDQYLRELSPSSHKVFDKTIYPDKTVVTKLGDNGEPEEWGIEQIARTAFPFQRVIATKVKNHLTGRPLKFTLANTDTTDEIDKTFIFIQQEFLTKNMNIAFDKCVESKETTGDCALYFFRDEGKLDWETFSYADGDSMLVRKDSLGRNYEFWRYFMSEDEEGNPQEALMIVDRTNVYEFRKDAKRRRSDWVETERKAHGFSRLPVCYHRGKVAWDDVQSLIEEFEWSYSQFCESNAYFAFPILFLSGQTTGLPQKGSQGKTLQGDSEAKANFISKSGNDAESFKFQFQTHLNMIFFGSFTVNITPDTLKSSGDMPSSAVRLVMHPEIEKAMEGAKEWDDFIDTMQYLFIEGLGLENRNTSALQKVKFRTEIEIYIPENTSELVANLNNSVTMGSLSKKSAARQNPYRANNEYDLIKQEEKETAELEQQSKTETVVSDNSSELNQTNKERQIQKQTQE